ncbi:signal peptidase I [Terrabacter sp. C0L_2]|jgi:signal peptidase|uniref:signal peptidase I n=1 Tax=Terrabacter sp. C0L_2 TaxID=3108389 RepID=UPI002ED187F4|nr:signal peptidase I [Terrabacter sp. C0L_2]
MSRTSTTGSGRTSAAPRRRSARVAGFLGNAAILVLMLLAVAYVLPTVMGYERYVITGGSMTGTYDKGSVVFDKVVPASEVRVGDVITYIPPASSGVTNLVTHRVVSAEPGTSGTVYQTKGDANPSIDPWTFTLDRSEQAVVAFDVPHVGWVLLYLADPAHRKLLIGIPAGLVALLSILEAVRNARRERAAAPDADEGTPNEPVEDGVVAGAAGPAAPRLHPVVVTTGS